MYRTMVTICTTRFNSRFHVLPTHSAFMYFVWISKQTAIISLYSINWLVVITETACVYSAVRTETFNIIQFTICLQTLVVYNWLGRPLYDPSVSSRVYRKLAASYLHILVFCEAPTAEAQSGSCGVMPLRTERTKRKVLCVWRHPEADAALEEPRIRIFLTEHTEARYLPPAPTLTRWWTVQTYGMCHQ